MQCAFAATGAMPAAPAPKGDRRSVDLFDREGRWVGRHLLLGHRLPRFVCKGDGIYERRVGDTKGHYVVL